MLSGAFILLFACCGVSEPERILTLNMAPADDSGIPLDIVDAYREDAAAFAVLRYEQVNLREYRDIELPGKLVDDFYNGLIHIYNRTDLAERDSVVSIYKIHKFATDVYRRLWLSVWNSAEWVIALRDGESVTGNSYIDGLIETYDLEMENLYGSFDEPWWVTVVFRAGRVLYMPALAGEVEGRQMIGEAFPSSISGIIGDGNDINMWLTQDSIHYFFDLAWGDCPAGCTHHRYWSFKVAYENGEVEYLGVRGDSAPDPATLPFL